VAARRPRGAHRGGPGGRGGPRRRRDRALEAESRRPLDPVGLDLRRHLLAVLLLWVERWYDAARTERREAGDAATQVFRRFAHVLARDFAAHHDAGTTPTRSRCRPPPCRARSRR
jgi:hypothetical protein